VNKSRSVKADTRARVERAIAQLGFVPNALGRLLAQKRKPASFYLTRSVSGGGSGSHENRGPNANDKLILPAASGPRDPSVQETSSLSGETARTMLRIVHAAQPISRVDLARRLEVNRSTVTEIVKPLIASGVLCEAAPEQTAGRLGRPPIGLSLRGDRSLFIGVNIGVRRTHVGAATTDGQLLNEESFDTPADSNATLTRVHCIVERLGASMPERSLVCIGVSVPGPTDAGRKELLFAPHLGWRDVPVADALSIEDKQGTRKPNTRVPVIVENDATAAAMYEARRHLRDSTSRGREDFVLVRAGTGIGVGLVFAPAHSVHASAFHVTPIRVDFDRNTTSTVMTLVNESTEELRFQISVSSWLQNKQGQMQLSPTDDIVFFPALLSLKAGEERKVRVGRTVAPIKILPNPVNLVNPVKNSVVLRARRGLCYAQ